MNEERGASRNQSRGDDGPTTSVVAPSLNEVASSSGLFRELVDSASECFVVIDDDNGILFANPVVEEIFGYEPEAVVGERLTTIIPERFRQAHLDGFAEYLRSGERSLDWEYVEFPGLHADGHEVPLGVSFREFTADGNRFFVGLIRDISRLVEQRERLATETAFVESMLDALPDVVYAFDTSGQLLRWNDRANEVTGYTDEEIASLDPLAFIPERDHQRVAESLNRVMGNGAVETLESALVTEDGTEIPYEFTGAPLYEDGEIIGQTGVGRDITERKRREQILQQLNDLNNVIRSVDAALIEATTRDDIETTVCDRLVSEGAYVGAAIGSYEDGFDRFAVGASAGVAPADESGVLPSTDRYPGIDAMESRSVQVVTTFDEASSGGTYRAVAVTPLVRDDRIFGLLGVYADRENAFGDRERTILWELGEGIANAIQGALTHQLLYANTVTEIELRTTDRGLAFVDFSAAADCRLDLRRSFSFGEELVFYVTVRGAEVETVVDEAETRPAFTTAEHLGTNDGEHLFEFVANERTLSAVLTEHGARTTAAEADEGISRLTVELPPDANVRELMDSIRASYPETEFVARREVDRSLQTPVEFRRELAGDLTEKQRAALEAAYFSGYFEWPSRTSSAEGVAELLDIAPQTFHQHLRVAQEKLLTALLEGEGSIEAE